MFSKKKRKKEPTHGPGKQGGDCGEENRGFSGGGRGHKGDKWW